MQVSSVLMIAVFFAVLSRSLRRAELRWWVLAWAVNLLALGVTIFFWYAQPEGFIVYPVRILYLGAKMGFVVLLILGAWALKRPGVPLGRWRRLALALAIYSVTGGVFLNEVATLGIVQHFTMGLLLVVGGIALARGMEGGLIWLASGLFVRALLALGEAGAYALQIVPVGSTSTAWRASAGTFLSAASSFDSGAEWLLALGCVLALSDRAQRELRQYNDELLKAQEELRRLADRDPLTGLSNRRSLPEAFRAAYDTGATLLFFDLDGFKGINDQHGHAVGDECLRRFAASLRECFRPEDAVVRYAGDEFLVITDGLDEPATATRIEKLRGLLGRVTSAGPEINFSVGLSKLHAGASRTPRCGRLTRPCTAPRQAAEDKQGEPLKLAAGQTETR